MDIRHLQYFMEVARYRSFTKAAESLYITQPTISKTIKNIEEELGIILFDRSNKKIELTDAGKIMFEQGQHIVNSFQNLSSELHDLQNLKKGHIRIGLPPMIGSSFFPEVIGLFHQEYPDISIRIFEDGAKKVELDVESGLLDIGVTVLPTDDEVFHSFSFVQENLMLLVHPTHALAGRDSVSLTELENELFVLFREDFALHDRIITECVKLGFQPHVVYESSQWDLISGMVAANLGIALLPETISHEVDQTRINVVPLIHPAIPWQLGMIWRKERYQSFATQEWIQFTQKILMENSRTK